MNVLIFFPILLAFMGCTKHAVHDMKKDVIISDLPQDFKVPAVVWSLIEQKKVASAAGPPAHGSSNASEHGAEKGGGAKSDAKPEDITVIFAPVTVILKEKNDGILSDSEIHVQFPRGGGTLDLANYVTDQVGSFYVRFDFAEIQKHGTEKVYFWSRAKKRKIENEIFGSGCNKILELGSKWSKLQDAGQDGMKVNTHRLRHVSVLGGRYFAITKTDKEIYLAQIQIIDSKNADLFCPDLAIADMKYPDSQ